ncbi:MAG: diacylglycerol/lipid kinase family protein [Hyphomicrobiaceae bacterium]
MRRRFFITDNPGAGYRSHRLVDTVVAHLQAHGATVTRAPSGSETEAQAAIAKVANSGNFDAIIVAGGDGTVRMAAKAALGSGTPIGVIPLGTGNVLAYEMSLPREAEPIAELLLHGPKVLINAARANGELFLLMAGVGFDGRVIGALDHDIKRRFGKLAYVMPTLRALAHGPDQLRITLDGHMEHRATWAVIANASRYGGRFRLAPQARLQAPELVAVLFHGRSRLHRVAQLVALVFNQIDGRLTLPGGEVTKHPCRAVAITSPQALPVQLDGDPFGETPLHIEVAGAVVPLIQPQSSSMKD